MNRTINRLKLIFLAVFGVMSLGVGVYQFGWAMPEKKCEELQHWWDWRTRTCARPIPIADITGRIIDTPESRAAAKAHADMLRAEKAVRDRK